ncbi:hypothetical protein DAEQUDRAFT_656621, partial [Daedalea quercina L-15889]
NSMLVESKGCWRGVFRLGNIQIQGSFEIFPSGGSWSFLLGKPTLECFRAVHDYRTDTVYVPGNNGGVTLHN